MAIKTIAYPESTTRNQTQTITIDFPMTKLNSIKSSNDGVVTIKSQDANKIVIEITAGKIIRTVQTGGSYTPSDTKYVTDQSSANYNSGGYYGTLTSYVASGSVRETPKNVFYTVTDNGCNREYHLAKGYTAESDKSDDGKSYPIEGGSVGKIVTEWPTGGSFGPTHYCKYQFTITETVDDRVYRYQGNVTRPSSDTRTYDNYYQYTISIDYEGNSPTQLNLTKPTKETYHLNDTFDIKGDVLDPGSGDLVKVDYYINNKLISTIKAFTSKGTKETFSKTLKFKSESLYDGPNKVVDIEQNKLIDIKVVAYDNKQPDNKTESNFKVLYLGLPVFVNVKGWKSVERGYTKVNGEWKPLIDFYQE